MSEIKYRKFRGKRKDNGEWVYGWLVDRYIFPCDEIIYGYYEDGKQALGGFYEVIPETVGQYVGVRDKNGKEIYKGDIVDVDGILYEVRFGQFVDTKGHRQCGFYLFDVEEKIIMPHLGYNIDEEPQWVVVGNIYENLELYKEVNE